MAKNITFIPAKTNRGNLAEKLTPQKKRVAAYCRVSTDQAEQLSSYQAQVAYYTDFISNNPDYDLAGIYADEGISGTNTKKREQFNKMIEDCKNGKIDMIITKSISRFARNTLDTLNNVRLLKELGINVFFEKENINTLDSKGEVLLTIISSLAQDESRNISENSTWGIRRKFEQGKVTVNHKKFLGYDKDEEGNLIINEKQAKIVRRVYTEFLNGKTPNQIARDFEKEGIINWNGTSKWYESSIRKMLSNEKYKGDALLQKTYTVDFLTKKRLENKGEVPQYYVEDSHPAIIDKELWEIVQLEIDRRREFAREHNTKVNVANPNNPFAGKVICGSCGKTYGRKVWNSTNERLRRHVWVCCGKYEVKGEKGCCNRHIDERELEKAFIKGWNALVSEKEKHKSRWKEQQKDDNQLMRFRAGQFLKMFDDIGMVKEAKVDHILTTIDSIRVFEEGQLTIKFLEGSEVRLDWE
jgi:DNA invertase Pin-like site-specific DNA recombinase